MKPRKAETSRSLETTSDQNKRRKIPIARRFSSRNRSFWVTSPSHAHDERLVSEVRARRSEVKFSPYRRKKTFGTRRVSPSQLVDFSPPPRISPSPSPIARLSVSRICNPERSKTPFSAVNYSFHESCRAVLVCALFRSLAPSRSVPRFIKTPMSHSETEPGVSETGESCVCGGDLKLLDNLLSSAGL
jgi:hypothetical protein